MKGTYEAVVVLRVLYGSETGLLKVRNVSCVPAIEMRCLNSMCGVIKYDSIRN